MPLLPKHENAVHSNIGLLKLGSIGCIEDIAYLMMICV